MKRNLAGLIISALAPLLLLAVTLHVTSHVAASAQAPQQASIDFEMTVGTDPNVCATSDSLTLPVGGGSVVYCYHLTNTGSVTLNRHDLNDERLGPILSSFPFALSPGATVFLTQTEFISLSTTNSATWTAYNPGPIDTVSESDSVTVNVTAPEPAITFEMTVGADANVCATSDSLTLPVGGGSVVYCYHLTNSGNVTLTRHDLNDERLGPILSSFPFGVTPGATVFLTQTEFITLSTTNSATWTAYNPGPVDTVSDSDSVTVTVTAPEPAINFEMTVGTDPNVCAAADSLALPESGGTVTYCYHLTNSGNVTLTRHDLDDERLGPILSAFPFGLSPGATVFLTQTESITLSTTNSATWTAFNPGPQDVVSATDGVTILAGYRRYLPLIYKE